MKTSVPAETHLDIFGLTRAELDAAAARLLPSGAGVSGKIYRRLFETGRYEPEDCGLPLRSAAGWRDQFQAGLLRVVRTAEEAGELGDTRKAVLATQDGHEIECVLIPMAGRADGAAARASLCISSQVGCRMGCTFCETGRMGLARNLTAAEIVSEVMSARFNLGWEFSHIVFMGMGEPLDNAANLIQALRVFADKSGLRFAQERLTVCTAGHVEGLKHLAELGWPRLNISISLNAADDELRDRLMPINRAAPLAELGALLAAWPRRHNFGFGINYCLLPGLNDSDADAVRTADFCAPLGRCLLNVIPYNPGSQPISRAPYEAEIDLFINRLRAQGLDVRRRATKGRSIMAGCGQLGRKDQAR